MARNSTSMDIIYHSIITTLKIKTIEQGFNYADSTIIDISDFFETREEKLEPKEEKKKSSAAIKKSLKKLKERKQEDSDSIVVESREESTEASRPGKKIMYFTR